MGRILATHGDDDEYVPIADLAADLRLDRSNTRKYAIKKGFDFLKVRTPDSRGQVTLAMTAADAEALKDLRQHEGYGMNRPLENGDGVFYLIQVIPELDPGRVKMGFTTGLNGRLQSHRTAAPTASVVKHWPCKKSWELAAIASLTRTDCRCIGNEVFECGDVAALAERGDQFFGILPSVE